MKKSKKKLLGGSLLLWVIAFIVLGPVSLFLLLPYLVLFGDELKKAVKRWLK